MAFFFGFNGLASVYHPHLIDPGSPDFVHRLFYAYRRDFIRLRFDAQLYLSGKALRLLTGFTHNRFFVDPPLADESTRATDQSKSLLEYYQQWSLIDAGESTGGTINLFSLGVVYDTRNDYCYCTDGKWFEAFVVVSPRSISTSSFSKFIVTYRQHASFFGENLTFSYRISSQQKLFGRIPFYFLPTYIDSRLSHDGVGGAFNLRGAMRNRMIGDGFLVGNFEAKARVLQFEVVGQEFFASLAVFFDTAIISQRFEKDLSQIPEEVSAIHFRENRQMPQMTFGPGLYIVFNKKNAISVNYGLSANPQTGIGGLYVGSSLLF
ncbi:MAG: hypothetical protein K0B09_01220 [Bacteroidales bacterium]|nr:hypothetical protein [Bacteroidales bacterium]